MAKNISPVCEDRTRGNGHRMEQRKFWTTMVEGDGILHEAAQLPSLQLFLTCMDASL